MEVYRRYPLPEEAQARTVTSKQGAGDRITINILEPMAMVVAV